MASKTKYFIGNWKMFGVPKSINILNKINSFYSRDKNKKKYKIVFTPPFTLIETFSKQFLNKKISIGAQNCFEKDPFSSDTAAVSPYMLKKVGAKYVIVGHSDNRSQGDTNTMLKHKVKFALRNKLKIIFCIGENNVQKKNKKTLAILRNQLFKVLEKKYDSRNIIIAYEPIWSIGTGHLPSEKELVLVINYIRQVLKKIFGKNIPPILYGGSVDKISINFFKNIGLIDGFLIGGASKSSKNFIDIIKNFYK